MALIDSGATGKPSCWVSWSGRASGRRILSPPTPSTTREGSWWRKNAVEAERTPGCVSTSALDLSGLFVLGWGDVAQRRVPALGVVERLDVLEDAGPRLDPRVVVLMVDQFLLQGGKEALHWCVIPALADAAHAALDPVLGNEPLVVLAGVLAASVRVRQQPCVGQ